MGSTEGSAVDVPVVKGMEYLFKVSSENPCGKEWSDVFTVSMTTPPKMLPLTYKNERCGVRFDWKAAPEATEYQIKIGD